MITTRYIASDGSTFDHILDAEAHDARINAASEFLELRGTKQGRGFQRALDMIVEWEQWKDANSTPVTVGDK